MKIPGNRSHVFMIPRNVHVIPRNRTAGVRQREKGAERWYKGFRVIPVNYAEVSGNQNTGVRKDGKRCGKMSTSPKLHKDVRKASRRQAPIKRENQETPETMKPYLKP